MPVVKLKCSCGKVQGETENVNQDTGTRVVCCCDDCQSFANYLNGGNTILDEYGGTDVFQMPVAHLNITQGKDQIGCVRLSTKGAYRWYTTCCNTPIGNTMGAGVPFIGVIHNIMDNATNRDNDLGRARGHIQTKFATKTVPAGLKGSMFRIIIRTLSKLLIWKLKGLNTPSVFFDADGNPVVKPTILN